MAEIIYLKVRYTYNRNIYSFLLLGRLPDIVGEISQAIYISHKKKWYIWIKLKILKSVMGEKKLSDK